MRLLFRRSKFLCAMILSLLSTLKLTCTSTKINKKLSNAISKTAKVLSSGIYKVCDVQCAVNRMFASLIWEMLCELAQRTDREAVGGEWRNKIGVHEIQEKSY